MFNKLLGGLTKKKPAYQVAEYDKSIEPEQEAQKTGGLNLFGSNFLGMTAAQRFIVALMFFFMVCIIGVLFLLVTETIVPY